MADGENMIEKLDPETEFLVSKRKTGNEWEMFKENVRPLKRGRNVNLLNHALNSHNDNQLKQSLLDNRRFSFFTSLFILDFIIVFYFNLTVFFHRSFPFRKLIEAIDEYKGDDPLLPWLEYITCFYFRILFIVSFSKKPALSC